MDESAFKGFLVSLFLTILKRKMFVGFSGAHVEQPMLRSTFSELWEKCEHLMNISCTRFREDLSLNPYIIRYWQLAQNKFYPKRFKAKKINLSLDNIDEIRLLLTSKNIKSLCLNDDVSDLTELDFMLLKERVLNFMNEKFPVKSKFEL